LLEVPIQSLTSVNSTVESVLALLDQLPADEDQPLRAEFAKAYLRRIPPRSTLSTEEWLEEVQSLFNYIKVRSEPVAVRVFNPEANPKQGTIVEINVEDGPFLLDSITNEIAAHGLEVARVNHPVIGVERDSSGRLVDVGHAREARHKESVQHYELDRRLFEADLPGLERALRSVLGDVRSAVNDFYPMMDRVNRMVELSRRATGFYPEADIGEAIAFLQWLRDNNFVFLGYREYRVMEVNGQACVMVVPQTGLGIL
jgi:glutamate dehydrogenase